MPGKDRPRQIVEASATRRALIALTRWLRVVMPLLGHVRAVTNRTVYPIRPAQGTDGFKAFGVVDKRLNVYHGASIAYEVR